MTLLDLIEQKSSNLALIDYDEKKEYSWDDLKDLSTELENSLSTVREKVLLLCPTQSAQFFAVLICCWRLGILPILVGDQTTASEFKRLFRTIGVDHPDSFWCDGLSGTTINQTSARVLNVNTKQESPGENLVYPKIGVNTPALGLMTSGTSAAPKVVVFSHSNLVASAIVENQNDLHFSKGPILNLRPPFTSGGLNSIWSCILGGAPLIISEKLRRRPLARSFAQLLADLKVDLAILSPAYIQALASQSYNSVLAKQPTDLYFGGMSLPQKTAKWLMTHNLIPWMRYGMTEIGHVIAKICLTDSFYKSNAPNEVGRPYQGVLVDVRNQFLSFQSPGIADFQFLNGQRIPLISSDWWVSDDRGRLAPDGSILLEGREHQIIAVRGFRFHAGEVQELLVNSGLVHQAIILGLPDPLDGQTPIAFCIGTNENSPQETEAKLRKILEQNLSPAKRPRKFVFLKDYPLLPNGKVDLQALKGQVS